MMNGFLSPRNGSFIIFFIFWQLERGWEACRKVQRLWYETARFLCGERAEQAKYRLWTGRPALENNMQLDLLLFEE
jgi:hypothetical protein